MSEELLPCPFCKDTDFDLIGLKSHIQKGECDACEALPIIYSPFDGIHAEVLANKVAVQTEALRLAEEALDKISKWTFPPTGKFWNGHEMGYAEAFGSNGERDFMRDKAANALAAIRALKETP